MIQAAQSMKAVRNLQSNISRANPVSVLAAMEAYVQLSFWVERVALTTQQRDEVHEYIERMSHILEKKFPSR